MGADRSREEREGGGWAKDGGWDPGWNGTRRGNICICEANRKHNLNQTAKQQ